MPMLKVSSAGQAGPQHVISTAFDKTAVHHAVWRGQNSHRRGRHVAPLHVRKAPPMFPFSNDDLPESSRVAKGPSTIKLVLAQGDGGSSGSGSGTGGGKNGDGGGNGSDSSGDAEPGEPSFLRLLSFLFQGHVLAILFSVVMYNRLQARQRRQHLADTEAQLAGQHSADQPEPMVALDDDLPLIQASELQVEGAPHSRQKAETGGPLSRLAAALPWTRKTKLREDIQTLKRLQRDAFEQMLRLDQRLDTLEERTNLSGDSSSGASALFGGVQGSSRAAAAADRAPVQASGQLIYGIGRPVPGAQQGGSAQQQHFATGPELRLRFNSTDPDSGRSLKALVTTDTRQSGPCLQKLLYGGPAGDSLRFLIAVWNGRGDDLAPTLHPQAGRGMTELMRRGCPLHQTCQGSGAGLKYRAGDYYMSAVHLRGDYPGLRSESGGVQSNLLQVDPISLALFASHLQWCQICHIKYQKEGGGMQTSTLLQMDCVPTAQLALGITGVQKGCDRAPIAMPAEGGYSPDDEASSSDSKAVHMHGSSPMQARSRLSQRSLALTGAWRSRFDEYAISGWLALDNATWRQQQSWGATLSSIPDMDGQGWALSLGRVPFLELGTDQEQQQQQLSAEAALHITAGQGILITPSVIGTHSEIGSSAHAALRAELSF